MCIAMALNTWLLFLVTSVGISLTPGPNGLLALTHGALNGGRKILYTIAGGLIGMGVDAATGAATDHKPNPVIVTLQPRMAAPAGRAQRPPRRSAPPPAQPEAGT